MESVANNLAANARRLGITLPPFVAGVLAYRLIRGSAGRRSHQPCCLKCGYILKGLSKPRCPECGEHI